MARAPWRAWPHEHSISCDPLPRHPPSTYADLAGAEKESLRTFRLRQCSARTGFSVQENPAGRSPGLSVAMEKYPRVQLGLIGVLVEELDPATSWGTSGAWPPCTVTDLIWS